MNKCKFSINMLYNELVENTLKILAKEITRLINVNNTKIPILKYNFSTDKRLSIW